MKISETSRTQTSLFPTFGQADSPARTSQWREWGRELGLGGDDLDSFLSFLDSLRQVAPELLSSRTCRVSSLPMEAETSESLFKLWPRSGMAWDGGCLTAGTSESPNRGRESSLSDAIVTGEVPQKYFLSPNAARGIIRRVDRMGRNLFRPLREALEILAKDP